MQNEHMQHENILYKDPLQFMHDLPSNLKKPVSFPDVIHSYIINVSYTNHAYCVYN